MGAQMQRRAYSRVCGASTAKRPAAMGYAGAGPATALSLTCPGLRDYKTAYPAIPRRHAMKPTHSIIFALATVFLTGCASNSFMYKDFPASKGSAEAGAGKTVAFRGSPLKLDGTPIKVGDTLRNAKLAGGDLKLLSLTEGKGKVRIISIVPSLDTKVCEQQTHYLSEKNRGLDRDIQLITVSVDTPFAQKRFADEANIHNVTFL